MKKTAKPRITPDTRWALTAKGAKLAKVTEEESAISALRINLKWAIETGSKNAHKLKIVPGLEWLVVRNEESRPD